MPKLYFTCLYCGKKIRTTDKPLHKCWGNIESYELYFEQVKVRDFTGKLRW